jgi:hypothetical protein
MHSGMSAAHRCGAVALARSVRRGCTTLAVLAAWAVGPIAAQTSYCRTNADTAGLFVGGLQRGYQVMDTTYLKAQGQPYAAPAAITLVTQSNTCKAGVTAYNQARGLTGSAAVTSAYVAALGKRGYVVMDPKEIMGEFTMMWVFDSRWTMKKILAH